MKFGAYVKLLSILIILFSCTKEHAPRWIVLKVTVLDYYTHEPIKASATIEYKIYGLFGTSESSSVSVGNTDANGIITIKQKLSRKAKAISLVINGPTDYSYPNTFWALDKRSIYSGSDEDFTIYAKPYYKLRIHTHNQNCFDSTDSLWVQWGEFIPLIVTGCNDYNLNGTNGQYTFTQSPYVKINSKKNGIVQNLSQNFTLDPYVVNDIHINY